MKNWDIVMVGRDDVVLSDNLGCKVMFLRRGSIQEKYSSVPHKGWKMVSGKQDFSYRPRKLILSEKSERKFRRNGVWETYFFL